MYVVMRSASVAMSRSDGWRWSIPEARISSCYRFGRHSRQRADDGKWRTKDIARYVLTALVRLPIPSLDQRGGGAAAPLSYHSGSVASPVQI